MNYLYKGNLLYNIEKLENDFNYFDIQANWKDKNDNNKEKLGKFSYDQLDSPQDYDCMCKCHGKDSSPFAGGQPKECKHCNNLKLGGE